MPPAPRSTSAARAPRLRVGPRCRRIRASALDLHAAGTAPPLDAPTASSAPAPDQPPTFTASSLQAPTFTSPALRLHPAALGLHPAAPARPARQLPWCPHRRPRASSPDSPWSPDPWWWMQIPDTSAASLNENEH